MKFNEANQRYLTEVHYTYHLQPLVISERVFEKLTPEVRQILIDAGKYAQENPCCSRSSRPRPPSGNSWPEAQGFPARRRRTVEKVAIEKVWPEMAEFVGGKDAINEYLKACGKQPWN